MIPSSTGQKAEQRLPGAMGREDWEERAHGDRAAFTEDENILKLGTDDGCEALRTLKLP